MMSSLSRAYNASSPDGFQGSETPIKWNRLKELKLTSLQRRRERYTIIHLWKVLQGICPNVLDVQLRENARLGVKVILPSLTKQASAAARSTYDHSFAVRAGRLWNVLPKIVNTQRTLTSFKTSLGNFLDTLPESRQAPTPGYSAENSISTDIAEFYSYQLRVHMDRDLINPTFAHYKWTPPRCCFPGVQHS